MSAELPSDAPEPRLCHLVKWPDFDGYGFNLHAEKAKSGQYIGKVDDDSPADHAGLKEGDRIIEVNGVNIANENHRQVVERIKAVPNETKLLVLDSEADKWYKERKVVVKSSLPNVKYVKTPVPRPTGGNKTSEQNSKPRVENNVSAHTNGSASPQNSETQSLADSSRSSTPKTEPKRDSPRPSESPRLAAAEHTPKAQNGSANHNINNSSANGSATTGNGLNVPNGVTAAPTTPPPATKSVNAKQPQSKAPSETPKAAAPAPATANGNSKSIQDAADGGKARKDAGGTSELNLNMSAAQMREMLANRKKNDPKKHSMDMREKYQIVQQM